MFKERKFLKVVAIIMIIAGFLGLVLNVFSLFILFKMLGNELLFFIEPVEVVMTFLGMVFCLLTGVCVCVKKSMKHIVSMGIIYSGITVFNIVVNTSQNGFSLLYSISFIVITLLWIGIFVSKNEIRDNNR